MTDDQEAPNGMRSWRKGLARYVLVSAFLSGVSGLVLGCFSYTLLRDPSRTLKLRLRKQSWIDLVMIY